MINRKGRLQARLSLILVAAAIGAGVVVAVDGAETRPLVVVSYGGGSWQESHQRAFFEPFEKITGSRVTSLSWSANYGKLKTDIDAGSVEWDIVEVTAAQFVRGKRDGLFEPLNVDLKPSEFAPGSVGTYGVANVYWATVIAYPPDATADPPQSWSDFWNVAKYPGPRALYDDPRGNLEFALLADGVDPSRLYPLDVDRAFRSLDKLKPHIRVWWSDGSQPIQLLATNQVAVSSAWNGRLFAARSEGPAIPWSWNGAAHDLDYWVIPKGAPSPTAAARLIWYMSQPAPMAEQAAMVGYGPANTAALKLITPELRAVLPTEPSNAAKGFVVNSEWWADNEQDVQRRWISWKASH